MIVVSFRMRRPTAIGAITADVPVTFHLWCNLETDFVQIAEGSETNTRSALRTLEERFGPNLVRSDGEGERVALVACPTNRDTSVRGAVERHAGVVLPPIVSKDGWDTFRAMLFDDAQAAHLFEAVGRLGEIEILSKVPVKHRAADALFLPVGELLAGVTRRQAEAIVNAAHQGYYQEPRASTLAEVAGRTGIGRSSLEEHLRKGENKVLRTLAPFVALRLGGLGPTRPRGKPFGGKRRHKSHAGPPPRPAHGRRAHRRTDRDPAG